MPVIIEATPHGAFGLGAGTWGPKKFCEQKYSAIQNVYALLYMPVCTLTPRTTHKETHMLRKSYSYHKPSEHGLEQITMLREMFSNVHDTIENVAPDSRERSIALTKLEELSMWSIKAVVCNDPESEVAK